MQTTNTEVTVDKMITKLQIIAQFLPKRLFSIGDVKEMFWNSDSERPDFTEFRYLNTWLVLAGAFLLSFPGYAVNRSTQCYQEALQISHRLARGAHDWHGRLYIGQQSIHRFTQKLYICLVILFVHYRVVRQVYWS